MLKYKLILVSPLPPPKGGISQWTQLITSYSKSFNDLSIINFDTATRWRETTDLKLWKRIFGGAFSAIFFAFKFLFSLVKYRPNVIHINTSGSFGLLRDLLFVLIAKLFRTPVVYHVRFGRLPVLISENKFEWRIFRMIANLCSTVIAIDKRTYNMLHTSLRPAVKCIPNCFDSSLLPHPKFAVDQNKVIKVVFLGWVIPTKGVEELLNAWCALGLSDTELVLAGPVDPTYLCYLESQFDLKNVTFTHALDHAQAMKILSTADIFAFPSHTEGFPNVVLEAMALGIPIIASNVGAIPEMLDEGCGLVIPAKDPEALREAILRLIKSPAERLFFSANCQEKAEKLYSIESAYRAYKQVWLEAIRG